MNNISIEESKKIVDGLESNEVTVNWHGAKLCIKKTLPVKDMLEVVQNVVRGSFADDDLNYMPELTDFVLLREVMSKYTNVDLPEDTEELYELLYRTDLMDVVLDNINGRQFTKIYNAINAKLKYMSETNIERFAKQMEEAINKVTDLVSAFSSIMDDVSPDDVSNLLAAVSKIGELDEAELVDAVIKSQAEQPE